MAIVLPDKFCKLKIGLALIPQKATVEQIDKYLIDLKELFPTATTMVSVLPIDGVMPDTNKPFLDVPVYGFRGAGPIWRALRILKVAQEKKLDTVYINIRPITFPAKSFASLIYEGIVRHLATELVIAEPQIMKIVGNGFVRSSPAFSKVLETPSARFRALTSFFINFILSNLMGTDEQNYDAGMFGIQMRADIVERLFLGEWWKYDDGGLVCPFIRWRLHKMTREISIKNVPVAEFCGDQLGFNMDKAVEEIEQLYRFVNCDGANANFYDLANRFFSDCRQVRFWAEKRDRDWFCEIFISALKQRGKIN